mgnify:CR=1 FL=1
MLKKITLVFALTILFNTIKSQNLQVHYDFLEDDSYFTSTLEMFKPNPKGATFWFVDFDYLSDTNGSASSGYMEFAKYFNLGDTNKYTFTLQFNDGVAYWGNLGQAFLVGSTYNLNLGDFSLSTELLYKYQQGNNPNGQITFVYYFPLLGGKGELTGFADIWNDGDLVVWMTEPQIWYSFGQLAVGGEVEISQNFVWGAGEDIQVMPTLGVKWEF